MKTTLTLILGLLASAFCPPALAQDYSIDWFTVDGGGGTSTDGYYAISGTIGQPDAGQLSDGYFTVSGGFWAALAVPTPAGPGLTIERTATNSVIVSWPGEWTGWQLQDNADLRTNNWVSVPSPPVLLNGRWQVVVFPLSAMKFYRLAKIVLPTLTIALTTRNSVVISWPTNAPGWQLQQNPALGTTNWTSVTNVPIPSGEHLNVVVSPPAGNRFYRLFKP